MNTPAYSIFSVHLMHIFLGDVILTHGLKQVIPFTRQTPLVQVISDKLRLRKTRKTLKDIKDSGKGTRGKAGTLTRAGREGQKVGHCRGK